MQSSSDSITEFIQKAETSDLNTAELIQFGNSLKSESDPGKIHRFLDLGHLSSINQQIAGENRIDDWFNLVVELIQISRYHLGFILEQRADRYGDKTLFQIIQPAEVRKISYRQVWKYVRLTGRGLIHLTKGQEPVIGILTPNSFKGVLVDLACLSFGFKVVPLPLNSTAEDLNYIIGHSGITHIFTGGPRAKSLLAGIPPEIKVIQFRKEDLTTADHTSWDEFLRTAQSVPEAEVLIRRNAVEMNGLATVMYTSGTTENPKGIVFTPVNLISKRFARALALPKIGSGDIFLSFLPLYHTFGRYLELLGSIFLGAAYTFARSLQFRSLLADLKIIRPSVFISIPKRWTQIREQCVGTSLEKVTGGRLKWGLSAAGFLEPEVFRFFQKNDISLMSGYGMTEATGGITMTPPDDYRPDSVGTPLPGIELELGDEEELLIRGAYVSPGYLDNNKSWSERGNEWFHTGDIFSSRDGHFYIIDRKKEIYKNSRGQTIAPQKIENLFKDFESVQSVFLVGDGREYNTVLICPNLDKTLPESDHYPEEQIREHFNAIVSSINNFLPKHERLVNFALIPRNFSAEHGELTKKGTFKRNAIVKNFADVVEPMYRQTFQTLFHGEFEIQIPTWLLREKGHLSTDILWDGVTLSSSKAGASLMCEIKENGLQLGEFIYQTENKKMSIQNLLRSPELWLGNKSLVDFLGDVPFRLTEFSPSGQIKLNTSFLGFESENKKKTSPATLKTGNGIRENLLFLHNRAILLLTYNKQLVEPAMKDIIEFIQDPSRVWPDIIRALLLRLRVHPNSAIRFRMIEHILPYINENVFAELVEEALHHAYLNKETFQGNIDGTLLTQAQVEALAAQIKVYRNRPGELRGFPTILIQFILDKIVQYGSIHPEDYCILRSELHLWTHEIYPKKLTAEAEKHSRLLIKGFRSGLGAMEANAVDPESGKKYSWKDTLTFDENIPKKFRTRVFLAVEKTLLIREAVFLSSATELNKLKDIPPEGIWISLLEEKKHRIILRVLVQTRDKKAYNFVIQAYGQIRSEQIKKDLYWKNLMGAQWQDSKLGKELYGYWPEYGIITEEYIAGEPVSETLNRYRSEIEGGQAVDRWQMKWLHYIWNAADLYFEFWKRSGCQTSLAAPSCSNFIIPEYDYVRGGWIISVSDRKQTGSVAEVLNAFQNHYIYKTEAKFPKLSGMVTWEALFTVVMEIFNDREGPKLLGQLEDDLKKENIRKKISDPDLTPERVADFILDTKENGIMTKQLVFASLRYQRWLDLNPNASLNARGEIIQELYQDYNLGELSSRDAAVRLRFFLLTCFRDSPEDLTDHLEQLMAKLRGGVFTEESLAEQLHLIHTTLQLGEADQFFLTRLVFQHVGAADFAELVAIESGQKGRLDLIVYAEDWEGSQYTLRPPFRPREAAAFHSMLAEADLKVSFRPDHEFLLLFDSNNKLAGGVFWRSTSEHNAHLEKVVIDPDYRLKGLSVRVLDELVNRLKSRKFEHLTVGFMQSELFYKLGFRIDSRFGGLVLPLEENILI